MKYYSFRKKKAQSHTYKSTTEKQLGVTLNQSYVTAMLGIGMIYPGNSNILHRLILGKTRASEVRRFGSGRTGTGMAIANSAARS